MTTEWSLPDAGYGNWFWGLTPSCIRALLKTAGLAIREELVHRYVYTAVCDVASRARSSHGAI